ncbi:MAG: VIT1/CCC1 transporter family protein [Calditrichia bacterium]
MGISEDIRRRLMIFQRNEITEHHLYRLIAQKLKPSSNRDILQKIAEDELKHYNSLKHYTGEDVKPARLRIWFYYLLSRIFGFTFGIKLMEMAEERTQDAYMELRHQIPVLDNLIREENEHEETLIGLLDEERLRYAGSMVLGLNDALVELTGALAGLTLAFQNTQLIALSGFITGIAAALSMASSEYLSTKSEETTRHPVKASLYTGAAYLITVVILIMPYLILENYYLCLAVTLAAAIVIIALFNYYIAVARDEPFRKRFLEMAGISFGVALFSFLMGFVIRKFLGVEI